MDKVENYFEVQNAFNNVKNFKSGFITNFYPEKDKISSYINLGQFNKVIIKDTTFFLRNNIDFSYLYYCSTSVDSLKYALSKLNSKLKNHHLVADLIGRELDMQLMVQAFEENGFFNYTILNRMSKISVNEIINDTNPNIRRANKTDAKTIVNLLYQYFDPIAEQLPTKKEIDGWINANHIIVYLINNEVVGFLIYDLTGITSYLRYWFVHPEHRNKKIGAVLMNEFFKKSIGTKRQLFWVIKTNENAIKRYMHYGFNPEDLYDFVMTNKNIRYEEKDN